MAFAVASRVKETTTTTGTGTINLAGAESGYQTFVAGIGDGNVTYYCIESGTAWEVGLGTVTDATPDTLSRTTIVASSNSGSAITLSGTSTVFCTQPGERPFLGAPDAVLEDQKAGGTEGGTETTANIWHSRDLNTTVRNVGSVLTLSSDQFTPSQDGWVEYSTIMYDAENGKGRLYNDTDDTVSGISLSNHKDTYANGVYAGGAAVLAGKTYEVQSWNQTYQGITLHGWAPSSNGADGAAEVYTRVLYWRTG